MRLERSMRIRRQQIKSVETERASRPKAQFNEDMMENGAPAQERNISLVAISSSARPAPWTWSAAPRDHAVEAVSNSLVAALNFYTHAALAHDGPRPPRG